MLIFSATDTAEGFFVCFDDVMTKLHNLKASQAGQMLVSLKFASYCLYHLLFSNTFTIFPTINRLKKV